MNEVLLVIFLQEGFTVLESGSSELRWPPWRERETQEVAMQACDASSWAG
jgi:hypothetical protein